MSTDQQGGPKKAYQTPKLTEWGSVTHLTAAGGLKGGSDVVVKFSVTPPGIGKGKKVFGG